MLSLLFEQLKDRPAVPTVSRLLSATAAPCAADVLSQAWGLVQKQAAQISESCLRDLLLTNIPCHRELAQGAASIQRPLSVT